MHEHSASLYKISNYPQAQDCRSAFSSDFLESVCLGFRVKKIENEHVGHLTKGNVGGLSRSPCCFADEPLVSSSSSLQFLMWGAPAGENTKRWALVGETTACQVHSASSKTATIHRARWQIRLSSLVFCAIAAAVESPLRAARRSTREVAQGCTTHGDAGSDG
jgi:hypothetical protein